MKHPKQNPALPPSTKRKPSYTSRNKRCVENLELRAADTRRIILLAGTGMRLPAPAVRQRKDEFYQYLGHTRKPGRIHTGLFRFPRLRRIGVKMSFDAQNPFQSDFD